MFESINKEKKLQKLCTLVLLEVTTVSLVRSRAYDHRLPSTLRLLDVEQRFQQLELKLVLPKVYFSYKSSRNAVRNNLRF